MERFTQELSLDLPSANVHSNTFSSLNVQDSNRSKSSESTVADNFFREISEKIGRGLHSVGDSDITLNTMQNQRVLNGTVTSDVFPSNDWIRQAEYDKFMNEIWIGIVLTLIVISMVFCICSCFLYHQFRQWKTNYHRNIQQNDVESVKLNIQDDDLPNYTLVSGLPSYDAAMEQIYSSSVSNKCITMYPSVFKIFASEKREVLECTSSYSVEKNLVNSCNVGTQNCLTDVKIESTYVDPINIATVPSYQQALLSSNFENH